MNEKLQIVFGLLGGLAIFLYGMNMMSECLQKAAGEKMKTILALLTKNPILGVLAGALTTAVLQSSSATTVMAIGFVSAGLMNLPQAISIIIGANIGTTMTAQIIAFKLSDYIYIIIFIGFIISFIVKSERAKSIGQTIFAFGLLFLGIETMGSVMKPLASSPVFTDLIERVAHIPVLGVAVGTLMTLVVQSSSATIAVLQNFASQPGPDGVTSILGLAGAIPILLGDNIGTTITGQLIALDVGALAPLIAFIGVALVVFSKNEKVQFVGEIIAGLGILFVGMNMMGDSMIPLREYPPFINLMTRFSNPLIGIIAGMIFTAVIQSSSASVGILQALALSGVISFHDAAFVLFGQNIGTCITAILASIGTERSAKRATIIHLSFNIIGTAIFTILCLITPITDYVAAFSGSSITKQIANMHTLFNISTTILLIPFGNYLAKLATKILPEKAEEKEHHKHLKYIKSVDTRVDATFGTSAINLQNLRNEIQRMLEMARVNVEESFDAFLAGSSRSLDDVDKREDYIDYLNKEISRAAAKMMAHETNVKASKNIGSYLDMTSNIERIGDHAVNICDYTKLIEEKHIEFSDEAKQQMKEMKMICEKMFHNISKVPEETQEWLQKVHDSENFIDQKTEEFYESHLERINRGECNDEACIIFSEMLTDFERIGDHTWNVAKQMAKIIERG